MTIFVIYYFQVNVDSGKSIWIPEGYSAQHCLLVRIENFKEAIDRGNEFGALLTDFFKAFDCINNPLLIAKLYNYSVSPLSIN